MLFCAKLGLFSILLVVLYGLLGETIYPTMGVSLSVISNSRYHNIAFFMAD